MRPHAKVQGLPLIVLTLLALGALIVSSLWLAESNKRQGLPSVYSAEDKGFFASYKLINRTVGRVYPWTGTLHAQFQSVPGVFITARKGWSKADLKEAEKWMRGGGIMILLSPLPEELGEEVRPPRIARVHGDWAGFQDLPSIHLGTSRGLKIQPTDFPLYSSSFGPEIVVRQVGKGRRIVFGAMNGLNNATLRKRPELGAVLAKVVALYRGKKRIVWDESYNFPTQKAPLRLSWPWVLAFIQTAILGLLYVIAKGRRLGPPLALALDPPLTLRDYLVSLAGFYRRSRGRRFVLEYLFSDLRLRLLRYTGLGPSVEDTLLAEAYGRMGGDDPRLLKETMATCRRLLEGAPLDEKTFYHWGKVINAYRKELELNGKR